MKRARWTRILVKGNPSLRAELASEVESKHEVRIIKGPEKSMVMAKVRDSVSQQPFLLGEILVSECVVTAGDDHGSGVIMGEDLEAAYQLAVIDAALNGHFPETARWEALLLAEERAVAEKEAEEYALVSGTRVNFNTMEEYDERR